jgi:hypothetical protein
MTFPLDPDEKLICVLPTKLTRACQKIFKRIPPVADCVQTIARYATLRGPKIQNDKVGIKPEFEAKFRQIWHRFAEQELIQLIVTGYAVIEYTVMDGIRCPSVIPWGMCEVHVIWSKAHVLEYRPRLVGNYNETHRRLRVVTSRYILTPAGFWTPSATLINDATFIDLCRASGIIRDINARGPRRMIQMNKDTSKQFVPVMLSSDMSTKQSVDSSTGLMNGLTTISENTIKNNEEIATNKEKEKEKKNVYGLDPAADDEDQDLDILTTVNPNSLIVHFDLVPPGHDIIEHQTPLPPLSTDYVTNYKLFTEMIHAAHGVPVSGSYNGYHIRNEVDAAEKREEITSESWQEEINIDHQRSYDDLYQKGDDLLTRAKKNVHSRTTITYPAVLSMYQIRTMFTEDHTLSPEKFRDLQALKLGFWKDDLEIPPDLTLIENPPNKKKKPTPGNKGKKTKTANSDKGKKLIAKRDTPMQDKAQKSEDKRQKEEG